jgi:hypothetical protein
MHKTSAICVGGSNRDGIFDTPHRRAASIQRRIKQVAKWRYSISTIGYSRDTSDKELVKTIPQTQTVPSMIGVAPMLSLALGTSVRFNEAAEVRRE